MPLGVVFPPEIDDPVPTIGPLPPGPWRDPEPIDPTTLCEPPPDLCDPPVSQEWPPGLEPIDPDPVCEMPPPGLGVDLSKVPDTVPPLGPPYDPWGGMWNP